MKLPLDYVLGVLAECAPLGLAESWDNVGLLIAPCAEPPDVHKLLLTIDLDERVLNEASDWGAQLIVAYHPPLFGGLKRLRANEPGERVAVETLRRGIFVYSPHTALDAASGGMTDWLAGALGAGNTRAIVPATAMGLGAQDGDVVGAGRVVQLRQSLALKEALVAIKAHLGLSHLRVAEAERHLRGRNIESFAVCPGAGGSVFEKLGDVDLLLTGEMRHHDVAARVRRGTSVVLCDHTNTERGFLPSFAERLRGRLSGVDVRVSTQDRDPLRVV